MLSVAQTTIDVMLEYAPSWDACPRGAYFCPRKALCFQLTPSTAAAANELVCGSGDQGEFSMKASCSGMNGVSITGDMLFTGMPSCVICQLGTFYVKSEQ